MTQLRRKIICNVRLGILLISLEEVFLECPRRSSLITRSVSLIGNVSFELYVYCDENDRNVVTNDARSLCHYTDLARRYIRKNSLRPAWTRTVLFYTTRLVFNGRPYILVVYSDGVNRTSPHRICRAERNIFYGT